MTTAEVFRKETAMSQTALDLSTLTPPEFDVLGQIALNNDTGHDPAIIQTLINRELIEHHEENGVTAVTVPIHVHYAWSQRCAEIYDAIGALPATLSAITLWQPWASLIAFGQKKIETRSWKTPHRGPLLIHAAKRFTGEQRAFCSRKPIKSALRGIKPADLPLGAALCIVDLLDVSPTDDFPVEDPERSFGDYAPGRYAWTLGNLRPLLEPVPMTGRQSLWTTKRSWLLE